MQTTGIASVIVLLCYVALLLGAGPVQSTGAASSMDTGTALGARFGIEYQRDELRLSGHVASPDHEQQLVDLAALRFSAASLSTNLTALDSVPEHWRDATVRLLVVLAATHSANAILTEQSLHVRGVALAAWPERLASLRAALPASVALVISMIESDGDIDVADLCARAMARYENGSINFEESQTEFRSSALPELERAVALANTCRDATIEIIGHTDASGDESWNRRLSLARAQAVADYLAQQGIRAERLNPSGVGSSRPIADNRTRYGRGLNRRIDIRFRAADSMRPEP